MNTKSYCSELILEHLDFEILSRDLKGTCTHEERISEALMMKKYEQSVLRIRNSNTNVSIQNFDIESPNSVKQLPANISKTELQVFVLRNHELRS